MARSAAEVSSLLHQGRYESEPDKDRREVAEAKAKRAPQTLRSGRFKSYKETSRLEDERQEGAQAQVAKARAKQAPPARKQWLKPGGLRAR